MTRDSLVGLSMHRHVPDLSKTLLHSPSPELHKFRQDEPQCERKEERGKGVLYVKPPRDYYSTIQKRVSTGPRRVRSTGRSVGLPLGSTYTSRE